MASKLNSNTLVLNRNWMAVQVTSVKRAISLLYQGQAKVVDGNFQSYDFNNWADVSQQMIEVDADEFICSPSVKIRIPRVIVLLFYDKLPRREVRFSRKNIFERDNYTCQYCGVSPPNEKRAIKWIEKNQLNLDHVVPRSRGGKTTWSNIVCACFKCNSKKGDRLVSELGWKMIKIPKEPVWHPTLNVPLSFVPHKEWVNFLDLAYWNVELEHDVEQPSSI